MKLTPNAQATVTNTVNNNSTAINADFWNFVDGPAAVEINGNQFPIEIVLTGRDEPKGNFNGAIIASAPVFMDQESAGDILTNCWESNPKRIWTNNVSENTKFIILAWYFTVLQGDLKATGRFELHFPINKSIYQLYVRENNLEQIFLSADKQSLNPDIANRRFFLQSYDGK